MHTTAQQLATRMQQEHQGNPDAWDPETCGGITVQIPKKQQNPGHAPYLQKFATSPCETGRVLIGVKPWESSLCDIENR